MFNQALTRLTAVVLLAATTAACAGHDGPVVAASVSWPTRRTSIASGSVTSLRVNVFNEPTLSGEYQVSGNGVVAMPLVGDVPAVGLTARELEAALTARYAAGYLNRPKIAVEVFDSRLFDPGRGAAAGALPDVGGADPAERRGGGRGLYLSRQYEAGVPAPGR
ncbi:polysaccharide biosynthesis/export family protein [Sphingomonas sp. MMS24-JH45]